MQKIRPFLWFDTQAEEAAKFYVSIFKNSEITNVSHYADVGPRAGSVLTVDFVIDGMEMTALNAGPEFKFSEAISLYVNCESQAEVDSLWTKLTADGGEESQCGWLKDKYGVSWQIVPSALGTLMTDPDPARATAVTMALMKMHKIDLAVLQQARDNPVMA